MYNLLEKLFKYKQPLHYLWVFHWNTVCTFERIKKSNWFEKFWTLTKLNHKWQIFWFHKKALNISLRHSQKYFSLKIAGTTLSGTAIELYVIKQKGFNDQSALNIHLKDPRQRQLCFCLHARVWLLYFLWSMLNRRKSLWEY